MSENNKKCPKCGGDNVTENPALAGDDLYRCRDCRTTFGTCDGLHPLTDIFASMEFEFQNIRMDGVSIRFFGNKGNRQFRIVKGDRNESFCDKLTEEEWKAFGDKLFSEVFINKWKSNYFSTRLVDGSTWTVNVSFEKKHALSSHGCNGYPAYWNAFVGLLSPYFSQCEIEIPIIE